ncbi:lectin-46Cb, partial [Drosophila busckii]
MKHLIIAIIAVLSAVPQQQFLSSAAAGCPRRYLRRINGKCYYFSVKKLNWYGALNNCLRKGLTLADLSNPRDFYGAIDFLSSKGNTEDFWFGGNDLHHEGRFQYISTGRLVRFYSNYSIVEPAENSECDDCLEVRIRSNITVVADDNCLERQYFICSERYCGPGEGPQAAKPRHHSHEHLHHFHHDIGEASVAEDDEFETQDPTRDDDAHEDKSEEAVAIDDVTDAAPAPSGASGEKADAAEGETTAAEGEGGETTAAAEGQETTPEGGASATAEGDASATTAAGDAASPAEGDATTPAADASPAEGDATTPAEGDATTPAAGDATTPAEGDA